MKIERIMVAHEATGQDIVSEALSDYDLVVVRDNKSAQYQIAEDGIDLFVISIHIDESRAIELVMGGDQKSGQIKVQKSGHLAIQFTV